MQNRYFIFLIIIICSFHNYGQEEWTLFPKKDSIKNDDSLVFKKIDSTNKLNKYIHDNGDLTILKNNKIDSLADYIKKFTSFQGYTVQLVVSQINSEIKENRNKFIENFSDEILFDEYVAPNIYLYAGKFYNKNDAYHFKEKISSVFQHTMIISKGFPHNNTKQKKGNQN
jgi:hypothetical protein